MRIEKRKLNELQEYPSNPRKMSKEMFQQLRASIQEFGIVEPLVINTKNQVVGGNHRLRILKEQEKDVEVDVVVVDLPLTKEQKLNIALNGINGEFVMDDLKAILLSLQQADEDIINLGFSEQEIMSILEGTNLKSNWNADELQLLAEPKERMIECPFCHKTFTKQQGDSKLEYKNAVN